MAKPTLRVVSATTTRPHGSRSGSPLLDWMRAHGIPETRENYLDMAFDPGNSPEEWTAEHEMSLPEHLQQPGAPGPTRKR